MINDLEIVQWDYLLDPAFQLVNTAGKPLTDGWIEVYIHGTRDKYYCASDFNGTLHPFKIPLDSLGSNIVLASPANAYDVYIYNVYGSLVMSRYNVKPGSGSGSGVIPADASYGVFGTNELPFNNTSNTGFQFTAKDIGGEDITFHEITYPYGRIDCKEGVYFYSATIEVSNTEASNESVRFQVLAGKNPNQSVYWLDFDNTYLHKQLYTICGIANFVNEDTFRINVSPYQLTNGVKASASQVAIHKLSTVVEGEGGGGGHEYGAGWGILINNNEISVDPSIIPTVEYVDASVSAVSSTLISTIESVSGNLQDQIDNIPAQVQSDWNQTDDTEVDYIKNKPDLSVFATHDEVCAVSSVLQNEIDNIDTSEYVTHTELNSTVTAVSSVLENEIQIVSAAIPDVSDFVTHDEVSAVSSNLVEYIDNSIEEVNTTINNVSGDLVEYIDNSVGAVSGDIIEYVDNSINNVSGVLESEIQIVSGAIPVVTGYATKDEVNTVSSTIINNLEVVSGAIQDTIESVSGILQDEIDNIPEQVNADWNAVSGKAEILNKPDLSVYATHDEVDNVSGTIIEYIDDSIDVVNNNVTAVSSVLNNKIDAVSAAVPDAQIQSDWNQTDNTKKDYIKNKPDLSHFVTDDELVNAVTSVSAVLETDIQVVSGALDELSAVVASASGIEYGQFYGNDIITTGTVQKIKGNINVVNGRIHLKKGQSYQFTVRGTYNQLTTSNDYSSISYIEASSGNAININVDKTITSPQYFELSYDIFNLSADTDYIIWFSNIDNGKVNDLFIDVHSLTGIGGQGGGTGPGTEYTPGYGIQILNNVISVSGIAPQVNSDWNAVSGVAEILNKPEEQALVAGDNIDIQVSGSNVIISATGGGEGDVTEQELATVSGILQTEIETVSASIPEEMSLVAGNNITIEVSGASAIISSQGGGIEQVNSDWDAVSGVAEILNKPTEYDLIGGQNVTVTVSGTNVIIDGIGGSGDVSGKLPTTELGKFTIQNNVSGGPIEVICPTDQGFPIETVILDNTAVSGTWGSGTSNIFIVYKSPGYDDDYYSAEGSAILHIPEAVSGLYSLQLWYALNSDPMVNSPNFTTPSSIYGDSTGGRYVLDAGDYDLTIVANPVPQSQGGYGKYITLQASGPAPDVQALLKSSLSLAARHPELGITVNLDRYYLGNTNTITGTSNYTQAVIYTDPMSKKQSVYLPSTMPNNWQSEIIQAFQYGSNYNSPNNSSYSTKQYRAYKYTSSPTRYQFAYCTDWDYANKLMTFIAYDNSGNAIEKWTLDYTTYGSNVWTAESLLPEEINLIPGSGITIEVSGASAVISSTGGGGGGSTYTAGNMIDITNNTISVETTAGITDIQLVNSLPASPTSTVLYLIPET